MNDRKNFVLAIVLSGAFLLIWQLFVAPKFQPAVPVTAPAASGTGIEPTASIVTPIPAAAKAASVAATPSKETTVRVGEHELVIAPQGGSVRHWRIATKGQELDLVLYPDDTLLPLASFNESVFSINPVSNGVEMKTVLAGGIRLTKTLSIQGKDYLHDLTFEFKNPTAQAVSLDWSWGWGAGLNTVDSEQKENAATTRAILFKKYKALTLKDGEPHEMGQWAAVDNRYYLVAFLPKGGSTAHVTRQGEETLTRLTIAEKVVVPANGSQTVSYRMYVGPKGYTHLLTYNENLESAVDFGWFSSIGKVILRSIYFFYKLTGNYGWAIVLLACSIQILVLPLTYKSFVSMQRIKKFQPFLKELQTKYKDDPKRVQIETMNLYKKHKINPLGGCLPILVQFPIFPALYNTLRNAYELRGQPFVGWIHDLSVHDPYYILLVLMVAISFVQQRMYGPPTDPMQKQMAMMMPLMMAFFFFAMPAGLVLYWFSSSVLTVIFQFFFLRLHKDDDPAGMPSLQVVR